MARRHAPLLLCVAVAVGVALSAHAGDALSPPPARAIDVAKIKAKELEKLRLIAKLQADAPKLVDSHNGTNPLEAPIFHRYDRP